MIYLGSKAVVPNSVSKVGFIANQQDQCVFNKFTEGYVAKRERSDFQSDKFLIYKSKKVICGRFQEIKKNGSISEL